MESQIATDDYVYSGHGFCAGCSVPVVLRHFFRVMGPKTLVALTAGCVGTNSGLYPVSPFGLACYNTPFPSLGAAASGLRAGLDMKGEKDTQVVAVAGDGGIFDIGLQSISGSLERGDDILYLCYDNEAYMNTGIQRSSATPKGVLTTTTPAGLAEERHKKDLIEIIAAHRIPYCATASVGFLEDFLAKIERAKRIRTGPRFLHILSPCPVGWRYPSERTFEVDRMAVRSRVFPLYEIEDGIHYRITIDPEPDVSVADYLKAQGRFRHLRPKAVAELEHVVTQNWDLLKRKTELMK